MLCGAPLWRILGLNAIIWTALPGAVTKECLKRDVLGHRENNVYTCDHPAYTECCEHRGRFTCCEALVDKNLREQLQLWGVIVAIVVLAAMIYTCVARDGPVFESDTLKQAVKKKLGMRTQTEEKRGLMDAPDTSSQPTLQHSAGCNAACLAMDTGLSTKSTRSALMLRIGVQSLCLQTFLLLWATDGALASQTPLYIGGFFPITGTTWQVANETIPAIKIALQLLNNRSDILPDYELVLCVYDSENSPFAGMRRFYDMVSQKPAKIFMLGPSVSRVAVHVAVAATSWNVVQVSFSTRSSEMDNRSLYPFFFRTVPSDAMLNGARHQLIRHFGWSRVAVIYEETDGNLYYQSMKDLVITLRNDSVDVITFERLNSDVAFTVQRLKDLDARIIVGHFFFLSARKVFCEAYRQRLYGAKYVWILPGWGDDNWWTTNPDTAYNCTPQQLQEAQDGHFTVNYVSYTSDSAEVLGMTVREFRASSSASLSEYSAYAFDAVLSIGHVLHVASTQRGLNLSNFDYNNRTYASVFVEELENLEIAGISGPVGYDNNGNRLGVSVVEQSQGGVRVQVGETNVRTGALRMDVFAPVIWSGGRIPRDRTVSSRIPVYLPKPAFIPMSVISFVGFLIALSFAGVNVKHRHLRLIKLSSPTFNTVTAVGCGVGYLAVVLYGLDGRFLSPQAYAIMCTVKLATLSVAYSLAFGAMFSKTWRVHRIMANKKLDKIKMKDAHLMAWLLVLVIGDLVFLILWSVIDPFYAKMESLPVETDPEDADLTYEPYIQSCACLHKEYWVGALLVYKGLLLLFGIFLAWETRHIKVQVLNDSRYIGMCVYNVAVLCVVGVTINFLISDENHVGGYVISSAFIIFAVSITLCLLFLPKFYTLYHNPSGDVDIRFPTQHTVFTLEGVSGSKVTPLTQMANNIAIQRRLETLISQKDQEIDNLKDEVTQLRSRTNSCLMLDRPASDSAA